MKTIYIITLIILLILSGCKKENQDCTQYLTNSRQYLSCVSANNIEADCQSINEQEMQNYCWQYELRRKSIEEKNMSICLQYYTKITDYPIMYVNMCLEQYAINYKDHSACQLIDVSENPTWGKSRCYVNLAEEFKDISYCDYIDENQKVEDLVLPKEKWITMRDYCRQI